MPELLGVTNPAPMHDSTVNNRSLPINPGSVPIKNISDPSRINRSDDRTEQQDAGAKDRAPRFDSNFQSFLQRLGNVSEITVAMARILSGKTGTLVSSGLGEGIAEDFSRFMEMLHMDRSQFLRFLSNQMQTGTRFGGALFSLLRDAYQNSQSEGLRTDILLFLKRYSDYSSSDHIAGNLLRNLNQMARAIPARFGNQLIEMIAMLENGIRAGDRAGCLTILQDQILPFMSEYVSRTHDLGRARDLLSLLTLDITRYENGGEQNLLHSFQHLKNHPIFRDTLGMLDDQALLVLLKNSLFQKAAQENTFATRLAEVTNQAIRGGGGPDIQSAFWELTSAFLVNESVYMSLNHHIIPMEWNGRFLFSELWVDPNAEKKGSNQGEAPCQRFLFKIDIQSLGFFDLVLTCHGINVDLDLRCPGTLSVFSGLFEEQLTRILTNNGLNANTVRVRKMDRPLTLTEVFPKLFEGKDSVNVKI